MGFGELGGVAEHAPHQALHEGDHVGEGGAFAFGLYEGELGEVALVGVALGAEGAAYGVDLAKPAHEGLEVKLGGLAQVGLAAAHVDGDEGGGVAASAGDGGKEGGNHLGVALGVKSVLGGTQEGSLDPGDGGGAAPVLGGGQGIRQRRAVVRYGWEVHAYSP